MEKEGIWQETLKIYKIYDKINKEIGLLSKLSLKYDRNIKDLRQKYDPQALISTSLDRKIMLKRVNENENLTNKSCLKREKNKNESE